MLINRTISRDNSSYFRTANTVLQIYRKVSYNSFLILWTTCVLIADSVFLSPVGYNLNVSQCPCHRSSYRTIYMCILHIMYVYIPNTIICFHTKVLALQRFISYRHHTKHIRIKLQHGSHLLLCIKQEYSVKEDAYFSELQFTSVYDLQFGGVVSLPQRKFTRPPCYPAVTNYTGRKCRHRMYPMVYGSFYKSRREDVKLHTGVS
jgi:hypothetical protein